MSLRLSWVSVVVLCVLGTTATCPAVVQQYKITDLGSLGGSTYAVGINNSGQVVGWSEYATVAGRHVFRTAPNQAISAATDDLGVGDAVGINDSGQVIGTTNSGAFRTSPTGRISDPGTALGSFSSAYPITHPLDINNKGEVIGYSTSTTGQLLQAFRTGPNQPINGETDALSGNQDLYFAINDLGEAAGTTLIPGYNYWRWRMPFRTTPYGQFDATSTTFTISDNAERVRDINNRGQIVGSAHRHLGSADGGTDVLTAFILDGSTVYELPSLGGYSTEALAINAQADVVGVGEVIRQSGIYHAFLYRNGVMTDLNTLIGANSSWALTEALDINDSGQIVGNGIYAGQSRAFLLTPIPLPPAFWSGAMLLGGVGLMKKIRSKASAVRCTCD